MFIAEKTPIAEEEMYKTNMIGIIWIRGEIDEQVHSIFIHQFNVFAADDEIDEIQINICSPGGDIDYGISIMEEIRLADKRVVTCVQGLAGSMAVFIAQMGERRMITKKSFISLHRAHLLVPEAPFSDEDATGVSKMIQKRETPLLQFLSEKIGKSVSQIKKDIGPTDQRAFTAKEAKKYGLIDKII